LEITGMSLIVLRKKHFSNNKEIYLRPIMDKKDKNKIHGVKWIDDKFDIEIRKKDSSYF